MESNKWRGPNKCVGDIMLQFLVEQLFIDDDTMLGFDGPWRQTFRLLSPLGCRLAAPRIFVSRII